MREERENYTQFSQGEVPKGLYRRERGPLAAERGRPESVAEYITPS